jgi:anthranilate synthase component 1
VPDRAQARTGMIGASMAGTAQLARTVSRSVGQPVGAGPGRLFDLHAHWPHRYPALLESAARAANLGRYDLLFACPTACIAKFSDGTLTSSGAAPRVSPAGAFLEALDAFTRPDRSIQAESDVPFSGGWLVFVAYEIAAEIEARLSLPRFSAPTLEAVALRIPAAMVYEHEAGRLHLVAEPGHERILDQMANDLESCARQVPSGSRLRLDVREDEPRHYLEAVRRAQEYIRAGDVYQVNLSRGWLARGRTRADLPGAAEAYAALRSANPAPFAASLVLGNHAVLSSSPERLCRLRDGLITTRPIAGTRPRTRRPGADAEEKSLLVAHPKERAEHVMLIDLERNDLGRLCAPGSVRVDEFMTLESYEHVHHIVSNVTGRLREDVTLASVLRAVFPGGTITGCPKVRCMQIIAELEGVARGAYTGSIGYLNRDGSGDFNILIRTMTLAPDGISLRAGAGIVADSDPERELEETRAKARGLLRALGQDT